MPQNILVEIKITDAYKKVVKIKSESIEQAKENAVRNLILNGEAFETFIYNTLNSYLKNTKKRIKVNSKIDFKKKDAIEMEFSTRSPIYAWLTEGVLHKWQIQPKWRQGMPFKNTGRPRPFVGNFIHGSGKAYALTINGKQNFFSMYVHPPYSVPPSRGFLILLGVTREQLVRGIIGAIKE